VVGNQNFKYPIYIVCARLHINTGLHCTSKPGLRLKHKP